MRERKGQGVIRHLWIASGVLLLTIGFGRHWVWQLVYVLRSRTASSNPETKRSEATESLESLRRLALVEITTGWIHAISGVGVVTVSMWGARLAWISGVLLILLGLARWTVSARAASAAETHASRGVVALWGLVSLSTGGLAIAVAWLALAS